VKTPIFKRSYDLEQSLESYSCHCNCVCGTCNCSCGFCPCSLTGSGTEVDLLRIQASNQTNNSMNTSSSMHSTTLHGIGSSNWSSNMVPTR